MNCSRFRFLIQQKFDMELTPQDERMLLAHMESCESCAKFHYQLQQVILAAEEIQLPEDTLPSKLEVLARNIMQQLPQPKQTPLNLISNFIGDLIGRGKKTEDKTTKSYEDESRPKQKPALPAEVASSDRNMEEDHLATSNRLRSIGKNFIEPTIDSRDAQSQTRSLGETFGMATPSGQLDDQPLTLAESIRRKVSEAQKPPSDQIESEQRLESGGSDTLSAETIPQSSNPSTNAFPPTQPSVGYPVTQASAPPQQTVLGTWGKPAPIDNFNWGGSVDQIANPIDSNLIGNPWEAVPLPNNVLSSGAFQTSTAYSAPSGSTDPSSDSWNDKPPKGALPGDPDWGPPPAGGTWDVPVEASPWFGKKPSNANPSLPIPSSVNAAGIAAKSNADSTTNQNLGQSSPQPQWNQPSEPTCGESKISHIWGQPQANPTPIATARNQATEPQFADSNPKPVTEPPDRTKATWSAEAEQIETGTWQAFNPGDSWLSPLSPPSLGWNELAKGASANPLKSGKQFGDAGAERRVVQQATNQSIVPGQQAGFVNNRLNVPHQQQRKNQSDTASPLAIPDADLWGIEDLTSQRTPSVQQASQEGAGSSITHSLGSLNDIQAQPDNRWNTPIQERIGPTHSVASATAADSGTAASGAIVSPQIKGKFRAPEAQSEWDLSGQTLAESGLKPADSIRSSTEQATSAWNLPIPIIEKPFSSSEPLPNLEAQAQATESSVQSHWDFPVVQTRSVPTKASSAQTTASSQITASQSSWDLPVSNPTDQVSPPHTSPQARPFSQPISSQPSTTQAPAESFTPQEQHGRAMRSQSTPVFSTTASNTTPSVIPVSTSHPTDLSKPSGALASSQATHYRKGERQGVSLFQNLDDQAIDKIFNDNLGIKDETLNQAPVNNPQLGSAFTSGPLPQQTPPEKTQSSMASSSTTGQSPAEVVPAPKISPITPRPNLQSGRTSIPPLPQAKQETPVDQISPEYNAPSPAPQFNISKTPSSVPLNQVQPAAPKSQGLFNLDDSAMDELFRDNLGVKEVNPPDIASERSQSKGMQPQTQPHQQQQTQAAPISWSQQAQQPQAWTQQPQRQSIPPQSAPPPISQRQNTLEHTIVEGSPTVGDISLYGSRPARDAGPGEPSVPRGPAGPAGPGGPKDPRGSEGSGGLFSIDDSVIDRIFADNLGIHDNPMPGVPKINVNDAVRSLSEAAAMIPAPTQAPASPPTPIPPQPQASAQPQAPSPPPNIEGVGRLDARTGAGSDIGSGRIASIGKFLLDQKDLEKIGKLTGADLSDTKLRILTLEAAHELQTLLQHIGSQPGVVGSVIVGHDGLLIANTMPQDIDAESIGVWALCIYMNTEHVVKKMDHDRIHQIVSRTPRGYVVIADFGGGLLVTVSDGKDTDMLIPLMQSITQLVAQ